MEPMSWIAIASLVGSLLTSGFSLWKQQKENKTTRDFNAEEAEKNRQWQEDIYNKYESPLAQVLQRTQAGLNPYGDVTSQSVGTGSTASAGSSSLPGLSDPFAQMPSMLMQLKTFRLDQEQKEATLNKTKEETKSITLDNQMKALEAGNREEWINLQMELMRNDVSYKKWSASKIEAEASRAWDIAYQSREFTNAGGNEFEDNHASVIASINKLNSDREYTDALRKTENSLRAGKVEAQDLANNFAAFEYKLQQDYGEDLTKLNYEDLKLTVNRHKELKDFYDQMVRDEQKRIAYDAAISKINYNDLNTLKPWQRLMIQFGKEVVEKGAELVL